MCVCVLLLVIFLLLFFSTRVCCLFLLFLKTTHAKLDIFFLTFVSSFEQSNGICMNFYFFCLLLLLKKWEMYHHIGLPFLKIQILCRLSSSYAHLARQICLLSFSFLPSLVPNWTHKNGFFLLFLKFKYGQIVSSKNSESSCEKVVVVFVSFLQQQQQVVQVWWSWMLLLCDSLRMLLRVYLCGSWKCLLVYGSIVSAFRRPDFVFFFFLNCNK